MSDFVNFKLAQKLKEKGFSLEKTEIYSKFDSDGLFHPQLYFNYIETMDCDEIIAPTISQVLKWLRDKFFLHISQKPYPCEDGLMWMYEIRKINKYIVFVVVNKTGFVTEEEASVASIKYSLDNLI